MSTTSPPASLHSEAYFPALTGVRAIAALLVFLFHAAPVYPAGTALFWLKVPIWLAQQGYIGVTIFFVLSGFLITTRYNSSLELTRGWVRRYLQNRFARIYPLYFFLTVFTFAVMIVRPTNNWYEWPHTFSLCEKAVTFLLNITLTRAFFQDLVFVGVPTAWTLTIEECFYLSAPLLLLGLRRNTQWIYIYPVFLLLTGILMVWFCTHYLPYYGLMESNIMMLSDTFMGRCVEFLVGMKLALWLRQHPSKENLKTGVKVTALGIGGTIICVLLLILDEHLPSRALGEASPYVNKLLLNIILPIPIAALLCGLVRERTWLQQLLQSNFFSLLGRSSYGFYLIHLGATDLIFSHYVSSNWIFRLVAYTLLSIALYKWFEHPIHQILRAKPVIILKS